MGKTSKCWLRRLSMFLIDFIIGGFVDQGLVSNLRSIHICWVNLHWIRCKSNFQTSANSPGRQMGTRWCQFDMKIWKSLSKISTFPLWPLWIISLSEEDTWRNIGAHPPTSDHHIGLISSIKRLARAATSQILFPFIFSNKNIFSDQIYIEWKHNNVLRVKVSRITFVLTCCTSGYLASRCLQEASCNKKCHQR